MLLAADDQVVKDSDVEEAKRLLQALGDLAVGVTRLGIPAGMVVEEDDGGSVELQGALGDDSAVDFAAVDGAAEEMLGGQDVVLGVEEDDAEHFVRQVGAAGDQVAPGVDGIVDPALPLEALLQDVGGGEQDAFFVHRELVLGRAVLGVALHRSSPPARQAPRGNRQAERQAQPHPGVSTATAARSGGPQQSVSAEEEARPCGRDSEARIPFKRPSAGGEQ